MGMLKFIDYDLIPDLSNNTFTIDFYAYNSDFETYGWSDGLNEDSVYGLIRYTLIDESVGSYPLDNSPYITTTLLFDSPDMGDTIAPIYKIHFYNENLSYNSIKSINFYSSIIAFSTYTHGDSGLGGDYQINETITIDHSNNTDSLLYHYNEDRFNFRIPPYYNNNRLLSYNELYPIGSVYVTSTPDQPVLGENMTWTLYDKRFKPAIINDTSIFTPNASYISTVSSAYAILSNDIINLRLRLITAAALGDSGYNLGVINFNIFGITPTSTEIQPFVIDFPTGWSDGGNGFWMAATSWSTSTYKMSLLLQDVVTKTKSGSSSSIASGSTINLSIIISPYPWDCKDNNFCNEFYWVRTA